MKVNDLNSVLKEMFEVDGLFKVDTLLSVATDHLEIRVYHYISKSYQILTLTHEYLSHLDNSQKALNNVYDKVNFMCQNLAAGTMYLYNYHVLMQQILWGEFTPGKLY